ncbi:MAG: hypothetical protein ACI39G_02905 [Pseudoramibacter sp.]
MAENQESQKAIKVPEALIKMIVSGADKSDILEKFSKEEYDAAIAQITMSKACRVCG